MKKLVKLIFITSLMVITASCATTNNLYFEAKEDIKLKNFDFAFMKLSDYLKQNPDSVYAPQIKFAIIEYYFQTKNYRLALEELEKYINEYPGKKNVVFAEAILYKTLSVYEKESPLLEKLKEAFFSKSIFLIFSESKTKSYTSLFNNYYEIVDYVDRVEVFKNKELLFEIKP